MKYTETKFLHHLLRLFLSSAFLIFILSNPSVAQKKEIFTQRYQPSFKKGTVKAFLEDIRLRTQIVIEYSSNSLSLENIIDLDGTETSVGMVLQKILKDQHVKLIERSNKIILAPSATPINVDELVAAYTLFGFINEDTSREPMIDATIVDVCHNKTIVSNAHGYYSLSLPEGNHQLKFSYTGYNEKNISVSIHSNTRTDIRLSAKSEMTEIFVTAENPIKKNGADKIPSDLNEPYNFFLGENDPIRSVYLFPGVINLPENFSGMLVRGGGPDENLFLLDGTQIYNPSHMLGALSIINQTSMKSLQLFRSDFPSKYSGSLSSVIDVYTKDGNMEHWHGEGNLSVLSGSFTLEGPLVKNKTAVMASFRHSWPESMLFSFSNNLKPNFYDIHFKLTQLLGKNDKLMGNFYKGQDKINQSGKNTDNLHQWGNIAGSLRWNHLIGAKSFINTSVDASQYNNLGGYKYSLLDDNENEVQSRSLGTFSSIEHYSGKIDGEFYLSAKLRLNMGAKYNHTIIEPFATKITAHLEDDEKSFTSFTPLPFDELSGYAEIEYKPSRHFFFRPGMHVSNYQFKDYHFFSWQPRFFMSYQIDARNQLFASYSRMTQYLHLVTNPYLGLNADIWVPSTAILKPEQSESYNLGYAFHNKRGWRISIDGYWKQLQNITNYADGKSYFINQTNWEQNIESGKGWSYGMELMTEWTSRKFSLHFTYTLSWSWRQFDNINQGEKFPFKYDRRHIINLGIVYHLSRKFDVSALWSYSTGDVYSMPDYVYPDYDNAQQITNPNDLLKNYRFIYQFNSLNQYRTSDYQRFNASIQYSSSKQKKIKSIIAAGVYNIFGSPDQYSYDLLGSLNNKSLIIQSGNTVYNFIPYVSYTLKF
ncbi:MAG: TonB-dependent receptor [Bacteroidetes bacterium]|nr:TonB-dependent receptor [Bacteroidota bacterium]